MARDEGTITTERPNQLANAPAKRQLTTNITRVLTTSSAQSANKLADLMCNTSHATNSRGIKIGQINQTGCHRNLFAYPLKGHPYFQLKCLKQFFKII